MVHVPRDIDYDQTSLPWHAESSSVATHTQVVAIWSIFKNFHFHVSMFTVSCMCGIYDSLPNKPGLTL